MSDTEANKGGAELLSEHYRGSQVARLQAENAELRERVESANSAASMWKGLYDDESQRANDRASTWLDKWAEAEGLRVAIAYYRCGCVALVVAAVWGWLV